MKSKCRLPFLSKFSNFIARSVTSLKTVMRKGWQSKQRHFLLSWQSFSFRVRLHNSPLSWLLLNALKILDVYTFTMVWCLQCSIPIHMWVCAGCVSHLQCMSCGTKTQTPSISATCKTTVSSNTTPHLSPAHSLNPTQQNFTSVANLQRSSNSCYIL